MKTLLVTGYTDLQTRVSAVCNISFLISSSNEKVCLTSTSGNAFDLDMFVWDEDDTKVRVSRAAPGIMDLVVDYQESILTSSWAASPEPAPDQYVSYGGVHLRRPTSILQIPALVVDGEPHLRVLRGGPRKFSYEQPKTATDSKFDWTDFWKNWAGAAFFAHLKQDLAKDTDWLIIDCDANVDRELVMLLSAEVDVVLLLTELGDGAKSEAYHLGRDLRENCPAVLPVPAPVRAMDEIEILEKHRDHFQERFSPIAPERFAPYWFVQAEVPYVSYYMYRHLLVTRQHISKVSVPLYSAYQYLVEKIREATDSVSRDENLNAQTVAALLLDARQRVQWDVFISYSSSDEEIAIRLRELLRKSNIRTFLAGIDLTQEIGTQKWFDALNLVLERSKVMILLASARALESKWVNHEIAEFVKRPRLLVPIPLGEHELPAMLTDYQIVSWDGDLEASATIRRLLELVLGGLRATASSS